MTIRHFKVAIEPKSTSSYVAGLTPTTKRGRDISTDVKGEDLWILYTETDENHDPRHRFLCLFESEKEALDSKEEMMYSWGFGAKVFDYKQDGFVFLETDEIERPVRFIVQQVPVVG